MEGSNEISWPVLRLQSLQKGYVEATVCAGDKVRGRIDDKASTAVTLDF